VRSFLILKCLLLNLGIIHDLMSHPPLVVVKKMNHAQLMMKSKVIIRD
jgi:hypothetical protein